jgi:hypothetical protein
MKVAFGLKAHSGWAVLVVMGETNGHLVVVDRRRIELVENQWTRQPYHAAENLEQGAARDVITRAIEAARRIAIHEVGDAVKRERERRNEVIGCALLVVNPMPDWSIEEIRAVHLRMHKAEGVLFRDALVDATKTAGLRLVTIQEKLLAKHAQGALQTPASSLARKIATLGKAVGAPWGKDQKDAALAALVALQPVASS